MRRFLAGSLGLTLGLAAGFGQAEEPKVTPANDLPAIVLGRPVAITAQEVSALLGKPTALPIEEVSAVPDSGHVDSGVQPTTFVTGQTQPAQYLAAGQTTDLPRPMPAGSPGPAEKTTRLKPQPAAEPPQEKLGQPRRVPQDRPKPDVTPIPDTDVPGGLLTPGSDCCSGAGGLDHGWWGSGCFDRPACFWVSADYLLWWIKDQSYPPLVTSSPTGTAREQAGVLSVPGTSILFGGQGLDNQERSGGRFSMGFWLDPDQCCALEFGGFVVGDRSLRFAASSSGDPILARPFFDPIANQEASQLVAFPGILAGRADVDTSTRLYGADLFLRKNWFRGPCWHMDVLSGFRFLGLEEGLGITETLAVPGGAGILVQDRFGTNNYFYGGQTGLDFQFRCHRWTLNLLGKVALGSMEERLRINGSTAFSVPGSGTTVRSSGLLAQGTNMGRHSSSRFAVIPEVGVNLGFHLTEHLRFYVGYSFLYASDVARPAAQIDRVVNTSQLPSQFSNGTLVGTARPAPLFKHTDFWAQGVNFGLEWHY